MAMCYVATHCNGAGQLGGDWQALNLFEVTKRWNMDTAARGGLKPLFQNAMAWQYALSLREYFCAVKHVHLGVPTTRPAIPGLPESSAKRDVLI